VLSGGATFGPGKTGNGLSLNGTSAFADVGVTLVDTTRSFSLVSWAEFDVVATNVWEFALSEDDVEGSLFGLKLRGDTGSDFDFDFETSDTATPGFLVAQSTVGAQAGVWYHLAGVYDASAQTMKVYVDGALSATTAVTQALPPASGHFLMGRGLYNGATTGFLAGTIDEVAVYAGALSDAQVAAIYNAQR
jgi:hypothetical protein